MRCPALWSLAAGALAGRPAGILRCSSSKSVYPTRCICSVSNKAIRQLQNDRAASRGMASASVLYVFGTATRTRCYCFLLGKKEGRVLDS
jgi:hypothetical protein